MTHDTLRAAAEAAKEALEGVRRNMRANAPELSGKVWGDADAAIAALTTALSQEPPVAAPALPDGWVPLRLEWEPGYPEDVAFGPQRMMDRLKKWLDKHFAACQAEAAAPAQGEYTPNEKLLALADRIDHEKLWERRGLERPEWTQEQHDRCDAGVELRRYADLLSEKCWRIFPPKAGLTFRASTFDKVVEMARGEATRLSHPPAEGSQP